MTEQRTAQQEERLRTALQNKSLHLYCTQLSDKLNEAGITYRKFLGAMDEIENSPETVKSVMRQLGKAKYEKKSTTQWTTKECMSMYEETNRNTAKIGIHIDWPSKESQSFIEYYKEKDPVHKIDTLPIDK